MRAFVAILLCVTALSGCIYRDPQVHGPYLFGPYSQPGDGDCCRSADVYNQDMDNGWIEACNRQEISGCPVDQSAASPAALPAVPQVATTSGYGSKSAWN